VLNQPASQGGPRNLLSTRLPGASHSDRSPAKASGQTWEGYNTLVVPTRRYWDLGLYDIRVNLPASEIFVLGGTGLDSFLPTLDLTRSLPGPM
jgi:hypothetical protein